ncbi:MAG: deoxyribonuclease IV, partial [Methanobacteriota archaeon]
DLCGPLICGAKEEPVRILLENTAGQGTNLGWRFEHLADIRRHLKAEHRERVGTCLDTCHTFAAGYDISTKAGWNATWREFDEIVGLDTVGALHLNDSKRECGSRRDRHDGIGKGELGETPFRLLMQDERFHHIPMALETPSGMEGWAQEIALLRDWASAAAP